MPLHRKKVYPVPFIRASSGGASLTKSAIANRRSATTATTTNPALDAGSRPIKWADSRAAGIPRRLFLCHLEVLLLLGRPHVHRDDPECVMNVKCLITVFIIAAVPLFAQAQQRGNPDIPMPTKADAERVVQIISGDKTKTKQFCEIANLGDQIEQAGKRKDTKKVEELSEKISELGQKLGPEFIKLMDGIEQLDPRIKEVQEIFDVLEALDKLCAKK